MKNIFVRRPEPTVSEAKGQQINSRGKRFRRVIVENDNLSDGRLNPEDEASRLLPAACSQIQIS